MTHTIAETLRAAAADLAPMSRSPRLDAELLLADTLGLSRARLLAERDTRPDAIQTAAFAERLKRRAAGEPVAYILGHKEFFGLAFAVDPRVLIPRPETELLVELALAEAQRILPMANHRPPTTDGSGASALSDRDRSASHRSGPLTPDSHLPSINHLLIADIGTGSGAISVALASRLPAAQLYACDLSASALEVAAANVARHGLSQRITMRHGDLLRPLPGPVDLIVSNPPYTVLAEVEPNVRAYEPHLALEGGPDGAAIYRRLLALAPPYLRPGGAILLEIGAWQGALVAALLAAAFPSAVIETHTDAAGHDRVVLGRLAV